MKLKLKQAVVALLAAFVLLNGAAQAVPRYSVTDLGTLGGGYGSGASDINDNGQVVGTSAIYYPNGAYRPRAFLYSEGVMTDIGGRPSYGGGINNQGHVVGSSWVEGDQQAFLYANGKGTNLGYLSNPYSPRSSFATDVNASDQVVGVVPSPAFPSKAFLYSEGRMTDLGSFGGTKTSASAINDSGQIVGYSDLAGDVATHGFLYSGGVMTDLNSLIDPLSGWTIFDAKAINNFGQIVGASNRGGFLYSGGVMTVLNMYTANDINDSGQIVGGGSLYSDGVTTDLNTMIDPLSGWIISEAVDINNSGQIAANGCDATGVCRALLLSPVPEPEIYLMMLAGLGLLGMKVRRRSSVQS